MNDPVLAVYGDEWSLTVMCPWKLTGPGLATDWESDLIEVDALTLVARTLESICAAGDVAVDPRFQFSGGVELAVRADTDLDPVGARGTRDSGDRRDGTVMQCRFPVLGLRMPEHRWSHSG